MEVMEIYGRLYLDVKKRDTVPQSLVGSVGFGKRSYTLLLCQYTMYNCSTHERVLRVAFYLKLAVPLPRSTERGRGR